LDDYKKDCLLTSSHVVTNGSKQGQWVFEESFVDGKHIVSVCREKRAPAFCQYAQNSEYQAFSKVDFNFLLDATVLNPLSDDGMNAYQDFIQKPNKSF